MTPTTVRQQVAHPREPPHTHAQGRNIPIGHPPHSDYTSVFLILGTNFSKCLYGKFNEIGSNTNLSLKGLPKHCFGLPKQCCGPKHCQLPNYHRLPTEHSFCKKHDFHYVFIQFYATVMAFHTTVNNFTKEVFKTLVRSTNSIKNDDSS